MNLADINKTVFKGKLSESTMISLERYALLPLLKDVAIEDAKIVHTRVSAWKDTFIGRFIYKNPKYHGLIRKMHDLLGKYPEWSDFTKQNIDAIVDMFSECARSSARTYLAMIKAVLNDAKDEFELPYSRYDEKMSIKATPSVNVYLNINDLSRLVGYKPVNEKERIVLAQFLIGCYTGARHSDILRMTTENICDGYLTYVSQKTKTMTTVEAKPILTTLIPMANEHTYADCVFNDTIRHICQKVGINERIKLYRKGRDEIGYKWQFVASHTARRSFATNLAEMNVPILQIAKRMGHSDIKTTLRYISCTISRLDDKASKFFG